MKRVICIALALISSSTMGNEIWVNGSTGDDGGSGTIADPLATIQEAIDRATAGCTVKIVGGGIHYSEAVEMIDKSGTSSTNRIIIEGWDPGGGLPIMDGSGVLPDQYKGVTQASVNSAQGVFHIENCEYVTVRNLIVEDSRYSGISVLWTNLNATRTNDIVIEDCEVKNARNYGIVTLNYTHPNPGPWQMFPVPMTNITIRNNKLDGVNSAATPGPAPENNTLGEALRVTGCDGFTISGNRIVNHRKEGIDVGRMTSNGSIFGNLIGPRSNLNFYSVGEGPGIYVDASDSGLGFFLISQDISVYDNFVRGKGIGICIHSERGGHVDAVRVYNNVTDTYGAGFHLTHDPDLPGNRTDVQVYNNTFMQTVPPTGNHHRVASVIEDENELTRIDGFEFKNNIVARTFDGDVELFMSALRLLSIHTCHIPGKNTPTKAR